MVVVKSQLKRWGNSFGVIIPKGIIDSENLKVNQTIELIIAKNSQKVLKETFGMLKGKLKKSGQQIKDELRAELYDD